MVLPKFRFFLTLDTISIEVYPYDFSKTKFVTEQVSKQIFFRRKLKGNLVFINNSKKGITDFDTFRDIEKEVSGVFVGASQCTEFTIVIKKLCDGDYVENWVGKFSTGMGKFDLDNCVFEVSPIVYDKYSCILDLLNEDIDILDTTKFPGIYKCRAPVGVMHEVIHIHDQNNGQWTGDCTGCSDIDPTDYWTLDGVDISPIADLSQWCLVDDTTYDYQKDCCGQGTWLITRNTKTYRRYELTTNCLGGVGGTPNPPDTSWTLLTNDCAGSGTCLFYRCTTGDFEYKRLKLLNEIIDGLIDQSSCSLLYSSIFFDWNPDTDDPFYLLTDDGGGNFINNYVTRAFSWTNYLMIAQKRDIKIPNASNPSTHGVIKVKKLLEDLRVLFNVYWDIEDGGIFRMEHVMYWRLKDSAIDMRVAGASLNKRKNQYEHLSLTIPRKEWFRFMEGEPDNIGDFADNPIIYSDICSKEDLEEENTADDITTNLEYIADFPEDISDDGFCLIATQFDGTNYDLNYEVGYISGQIKPNNHLSWGNLLYNFHRYDRMLSIGIMNGDPETFFTWKQNIKQVTQLILPMCCGDLPFIAEELFRTELGDLLGGNKGYVAEAEESNNNDFIYISFKYSI